MSLNSLTIETLSVCAVKESIILSDFLKPFINENDKEPSWDGFVYIYQDKTCTKKKLKGRLAVQVKGKEHNDLSKNEISYSMSVIDLRNYLYDGGVILFVVYLADNGVRNKIYYCELPPIKLKIILNEAKDCKTKTIKLKEFPDDHNKKAAIFLNCLENCQKQASFSNAKLLSLEKLENQGLLEGLTIPVTPIGSEDPKTALLNNEVYIYANIKGSSIPQPLEILPVDMHTHEIKKANISIEGKQFYSFYRIIKTADSIEYILGESFSMCITTDKNSPWKVNYKNSNKIRVLAKDLDFMLFYMEMGYFLLNEIKIKFDYEGAKLSNFDIGEQKKLLQLSKDIVQLLDMFNCNEDFDINELNHEDWVNLDRLIRSFVYHESITGLKDNLSPIQGIRVGNLRFAICPKAVEGESGTYYFYDFFKTEIQVMCENQDEESIPISQYSILHTEDLISLNNIRFDVLLPSFKKFGEYKETFVRANFFLLDLLSAYDLNGKKEFLNVAKEFSNWIMESNDDNFPDSLKRLNRLQTIKRMRDFNIDEIKELYTIIEKETSNEEILVAAYLLLDQQAAAEIHFARLDSETKELFRTYPIYHFWNQSE